jgi:catechol 2,3-dioxygenase-like lactoylglutathione lyase family enzyme
MHEIRAADQSRAGQGLSIAADRLTVRLMPDAPQPALRSAEPQLFVTDIRAAVDYFVQKLGFRLVFQHGNPPFYAQVARDGAALNLRHVDTPLIDPALAAREDFLAASINTDDVAGLYGEFQAAGATFHQLLRQEPWGATTFVIKDPDGNLILFT